MQKFDVLIIISVLIALLLAFDIWCHVSLTDRVTPDFVSVVYATHEIPEGKVIQFDDVSETKVQRRRLPVGIISDGTEPNNSCPSSKLDVVGRTSLGIRPLNVVIHKYPGYAGVLLRSI